MCTSVVARYFKAGIACNFNALNIPWRYLTQTGALPGDDAAGDEILVPGSAMASTGSGAMEDSLGIGDICWQIAEKTVLRA